MGLNWSLMLFWLSVAGYKGPEVLVDGSVGCRLGLFSRHVPLLAFCPSQKGLNNGSKVPLDIQVGRVAQFSLRELLRRLAIGAKMLAEEQALVLGESLTVDLWRRQRFRLWRGQVVLAPDIRADDLSS